MKMKKWKNVNGKKYDLSHLNLTPPPKQDVIVKAVELSTRDQWWIEQFGAEWRMETGQMILTGTPLSLQSAISKLDLEVIGEPLPYVQPSMRVEYLDMGLLEKE